MADILDIPAFTPKLIAFARSHGFELRTEVGGVVYWPTIGAHGALGKWFVLFIKPHQEEDKNV